MIKECSNFAKKKKGENKKDVFLITNRYCTQF